MKVRPLRLRPAHPLTTARTGPVPAGYPRPRPAVAVPPAVALTLGDPADAQGPAATAGTGPIPVGYPRLRPAVAVPPAVALTLGDLADGQDPAAAARTGPVPAGYPRPRPAVAVPPAVALTLGDLADVQGPAPADFIGPVRVGYLRLRPAVAVPPGVALTLGDLADVQGPAAAARAARAVPCGESPRAGGHRVVSALAIAAAACRAAPGVRWQVLGDQDAVVLAHAHRRRAHWLLGVAAWLLLLVGAATTLLNFHADVNMPAAHRELYFLATGRRIARPLAVEIPYAIGVGLGALLFFAVPRTAGGDPGPLEIEIARYEGRLLEYWRRESGRVRP